jgi:CRP/FNR family transcriptional regulator, cyclic AMP receptor protein
MRIPAEVLDMLAAQPLFSGLSQKELRAVASLGTPADFKAGRVITEEGAIGQEAILIVSGSARCVVGGKTVATLGPGDLFGEISLLDRAPRSASVIADSDMQATVFVAAEFIGLVQASPKIALKLLTAMALRLRALDQKFTVGKG